MYELSEELTWDSATSKFETMITVNAIKSGDNRGDVIVQITRANGETVEVARWKEFQNSWSSSQSFSLTPSKIFEYAGVRTTASAIDPTASNPIEKKTGQFKLEIIHNNAPLYSQPIQVVNAPWIHSTQLSDSELVGKEAVTAYITVKNFGFPAEFNIVANLYDATEGQPSTLERSWWAGKTWKGILYKATQRTAVLDTGKESTVALVIPAEHFTTRHAYILETFAVKRLPFLKFPGGDWLKSEEGWRARDQVHYSTIVVLEP
jgi:hypothetical protein